MQQHALENFKRVGVDVRTGVRVTEVRSLPSAAPGRVLFVCVCGSSWIGLHASGLAGGLCLAAGACSCAPVVWVPLTMPSASGPARRLRKPSHLELECHGCHVCSRLHAMPPSVACGSPTATTTCACCSPPARLVLPGHQGYHRTEERRAAPLRRVRVERRQRAAPAGAAAGRADT